MPLWRLLRWSSVYSGSPPPDTFRPWAFSALRRFSPPDGLLVLFHTSATYGIQSQRALVANAELAPRSGKGRPKNSPVPVRKATDSAGGFRLLLADTTPAARRGVFLIRKRKFPASVDASLTGPLAIA